MNVSIEQLMQVIGELYVKHRLLEQDVSDMRSYLESLQAEGELPTDDTDTPNGE